MKTGTPPRVDGRSLDYSKMELQGGDEITSKFSFTDETEALTTQRPCHVTYTNQKTHDILRTGFDRSPMFNGDRKSTRLNSSHVRISYAVFCLKKKKII